MRSRSIYQVDNDDFMEYKKHLTVYHQKPEKQYTHNTNTKQIKVASKVTKKGTNKSRTFQQKIKKKRNDYEIDYFGQIEESLDLRDQFMQLSNEISELKKELIPLRQLRIDLERDLLERDKKFVMFNQIYAPNERQTTFDPIDHFITDDFLQARLEKNTVTNEMKKIRYITNDSSLKVLEENVLKEGLQLQAMRQKSRRIDSEIKYTYDQIEMLKLSAFPYQIQKQKSQIDDLRSQIVSNIEYRKKLKRQYEMLLNLVFPQTIEEIDQTEQIQKLLQQYEKVKNSTILVGFFKYAIRPSEIRKLFQQFGPIEKMESKVTYTMIKYRNREDAIHAVMTMNGYIFRKEPLIVRFSKENYSEPGDGNMRLTLIDNDTTIKPNYNSRFRNSNPRSRNSARCSNFEEFDDEYAQSSAANDQFEYDSESNSSETKCQMLHNMCRDLENKQTKIERQLNVHSPIEQRRYSSTASSRNSSKSNPRRIRNLHSSQSQQNLETEIQNLKMVSKHEREKKNTVIMFDDIEMKFDSDVYIQRITEPSNDNRKRSKHRKKSSNRNSHDDLSQEKDSQNLTSNQASSHSNQPENNNDNKELESSGNHQSSNSQPKAYQSNTDSSEFKRSGTDEKQQRQDMNSDAIHNKSSTEHIQANNSGNIEARANDEENTSDSKGNTEDKNDNLQNNQMNMQSLIPNIINALTNNNEDQANSNNNTLQSLDLAGNKVKSKQNSGNSDDSDTKVEEEESDNSAF